MCNCGRKQTEVITSAQASQDAAARAAADAEQNLAMAQASAQAALANATSGWFAMAEVPAE